LHPSVKAPTEDGDVRLGDAGGLPIDDTGAASAASASAASFDPLGGYGCRGGAGRVTRVAGVQGGVSASPDDGAGRAADWRVLDWIAMEGVVSAIG
jgi:hypothetical protein